jgi:2-polyprenyl-3-methyl-5-hydroxy-6-metoxy-1,4-benzoquinol methylase
MRRIGHGIRWRLGLHVVAPALEGDSDEGIAAFYQSRITDCLPLSDPNHYEHPRAQWITDRVESGRFLELGCGNGGMTRLLAPRVERLIALDVSSPSVEAAKALGLPNVDFVESLIEQYQSGPDFNGIVMSEVLEHLRRPGQVIARCLDWLVPGGKLLVTTPNGHWESNEHLQEFTLQQFCLLFVDAGYESVLVSYLRDDQNRRRWLAAEAFAGKEAPAPEDFNCRSVIARQRKAK